MTHSVVSTVNVRKKHNNLVKYIYYKVKWKIKTKKVTLLDPLRSTSQAEPSRPYTPLELDILPASPGSRWSYTFPPVGAPWIIYKLISLSSLKLQFSNVRGTLDNILINQSRLSMWLHFSTAALGGTSHLG